jgi:hypothetical protein
MPNPEKQPLFKRKPILSLAAAIALFTSTEGKTQQPENNNGEAGVEVALSGGGSTRVRDFLHDPGVRHIGQDENGYDSLVGNPDDLIPHEAYRITYFPPDRSFAVFLYRRTGTLGETRRRAAADLARRLGVPPQELCSLIVGVETPRDVDASRSGQNLGLPECSGATALPGD